MKILMLSHVIFPTNNARSNRTMELAAELSRQGHTVTLYAALGKYNYRDLEDELGLEIRNLGSLIVHPLNSDGKIGNRQVFVDLMRYVIRPFFDLREIELAFLSYKSLVKEAKSNGSGYDLIISIAPPHSINWGVALFMSWHKKYRDFFKNWIADCGDPYMKNPFHRVRPPFYFKYIEKWFCRLVDFITVPVEEAKSGYYSEFHDKIRVIPQGVNFNIAKIPKEAPRNTSLVFMYAGALYRNKRDPSEFLDYLLTKKQLDFQFVVFSKNTDLFDNYRSEFGDKLIVKDYIPRKELIQTLAKADFLVNFENIGSVQSPSKMIDYSLSKRPILSVSMSNFNTEVVDQFLNKIYDRQTIVSDIDRFNIERVAKQFINLCR